MGSNTWITPCFRPSFCASPQYVSDPINSRVFHCALLACETDPATCRPQRCDLTCFLSCTLCAHDPYSVYRYCTEFSVSGYLQCPDPTSCAPGNYSTNGMDYMGDGACNPCDAGSYSTSPGATNCSSCPSGTTSPVGSTSLSDCVASTTTGTCNKQCDKIVADIEETRDETGLVLKIKLRHPDKV